MTRPAFKELMILIACTGVGESKGIEPFASYLDDGHELTPFLRRWLIAMLRRDKSQSHHLIYKKRVGRPADPIDQCFAAGRDVAVLSRCTTSVEPLVEYLEAEGELTPLHRRWLVSSLRRDRALTHVLQLVTYGRRDSIEQVFSDLELEGRFFDLHQITITDAFCESLEDQLCFEPAPVEERDEGNIYRFGIDIPDLWGAYWTKPIVRFQVGKPLIDFQIHHLLAAEFCISLATVKRKLLTIKKARRTQ